MSQENVEVVRRGLEAAARNDWNEVMASVDPSIEWVEMPSLGPDASTYTGMDELREAISSWMGMWSQYDAEVVRYADAGDAFWSCSENAAMAASGGPPSSGSLVKSSPCGTAR
jgi:ketosteroid isomerase-like protein